MLGKETSFSFFKNEAYLGPFVLTIISSFLKTHFWPIYGGDVIPKTSGYTYYSAMGRGEVGQRRENTIAV